MQKAEFKDPIKVKSVESQFNFDSKDDQGNYIANKLKSLALKGISGEHIGYK